MIPRNVTRVAVLAALAAGAFAIYYQQPPVGQCVDLELVAQEPDDAGRARPVQHAYRYCNLTGADAAIPGEGVVWSSAPFAAPGGSKDGLSKLSAREERATSCACRCKTGPGNGCRVRTDAGLVAAPMGQTLAPGSWSGPCCVTPCVESEARESAGGPGALLPQECR